MGGRVVFFTRTGIPMLVISRKKHESFVIGDNITVTILDVRGDNIQIGIDAPRDLRILRTELKPHTPEQQEGD